jgi:hypothetical protein
MLACAFPATAEMPVGALGTVYGTDETIFEADDVPTAFCANTSKS